MSEIERIFDRFIDAFASDLIAIAQDCIDAEVSRALSKLALTNKQSNAQLRAQRKAERIAAKAAAKAERQRAREEKRAARLAEKERIKAERLAEKSLRQAEHDRLKQERLALKQELEAERRRLREASRKKPARQLPLDFDGLRTPKQRQKEPAPAPLFVIKRKRDGQIEKLARPGDEAPKSATNGNAPAAEATDSAAPRPLTNGAATIPPEVPLPAE